LVSSVLGDVDDVSELGGVAPLGAVDEELLLPGAVVLPVVPDGAEVVPLGVVVVELELLEAPERSRGSSLRQALNVPKAALTAATKIKGRK
jgi:hypothetical protein